MHHYNWFWCKIDINRIFFLHLIHMIHSLLQYLVLSDSWCNFFFFFLLFLLVSMQLFSSRLARLMQKCSAMNDSPRKKKEKTGRREVNWKWKYICITYHLEHFHFAIWIWYLKVFFFFLNRKMIYWIFFIFSSLLLRTSHRAKQISRINMFLVSQSISINNDVISYLIVSQPLSFFHTVYFLITLVKFFFYFSPSARILFFPFKWKLIMKNNIFGSIITFV